MIDLTWRSELAYIIGYITADGYLSNTTKRISIVSKDLQILEEIKECLLLQNLIGHKARGGESIKKYHYLAFKNKVFYDFLNQIGITNAKSKTIQSVTIPDEYFADFLRGLYDGDGTFYTQWDTRWPNSFVYHIEVASASKTFIYWLKVRLTSLYSVKGYIKTGKGVFILRYAKKDSRTLFQIMHHQENLLCLQRKRERIKAALEFDSKMKQNSPTPR